MIVSGIGQKLNPKPSTGSTIFLRFWIMLA